MIWGLSLLTHVRSSCVPQRLWRLSMAVNSSEVISFNGCLQSGRALIWAASLTLLHSSDTEDSSFMVSGQSYWQLHLNFAFQSPKQVVNVIFPTIYVFLALSWIENNATPVEVNVHPETFPFRVWEVRSPILPSASSFLFDITCYRNYEAT